MLSLKKLTQSDKSLMPHSIMGLSREVEKQTEYSIPDSMLLFSSFLSSSDGKGNK